MFQRILVGLKNTAASKRSFEYAVQLARKERAELHVLSVGSIPEITAATADEVMAAQNSAREEFIPLLKAARETAELSQQPVLTELRFGSVAHGMTAYAVEKKIDLIVVGKRQRHFGATGENIIRHAPCPVFVASETEVIKYTGPVGHRKEEWEIRKDNREKLEGRAKLLRIFIGDEDHWEGAPLYEAIVRRLREADIAGATVYRGIMGFGAHQRVHKRGLLHLSSDLPMIVSVVDHEANIRRAISLIDEMVDEGLVVLSDVEVVKYTHTHASMEVPEIIRRRATDW
jgi:PII-like signaling protein/nucleotide-binding universal stress UspA family protein